MFTQYNLFLDQVTFIISKHFSYFKKKDNNVHRFAIRGELLERETKRDKERQRETKIDKERQRETKRDKERQREIKRHKDTQKTQQKNYDRRM